MTNVMVWFEKVTVTFQSSWTSTSGALAPIDLTLSLIMSDNGDATNGRDREREVMLVILSMLFFVFPQGMCRRSRAQCVAGHATALYC